MQDRPSLIRRFLPFAQLLALLALAAVTISTLIDQRRELHAEVENQLQSEVQDRVAAWEDEILDRLERWMQYVGENWEDPSAVQAHLRTREPWFDALYLWVPPRQVLVAGKRKPVPAEFLFPRSHSPLGARTGACIEQARQRTMRGGVSPEEAAAVWLQSCRREMLSVRIRAATAAANVLESANHPEEALAALDTTGLGPDRTIREGMRLGVQPHDLVVYRLRRADLLVQLGRADEALDAYHDIGLEITQLDAPDAAPLLLFVQVKVLPELSGAGRDDQVANVELALERAERRLRAIREIEQRIFERSPSQATEAPRFIYDQYGETPFLLYYGPVRQGQLGAALQLDQPLLLMDFLSQMRRFRAHLVITDLSGRFVGGSRATEDLPVQVPFQRTLTHLRVGLHRDALDERFSRLDRGWVVIIALSGFTVLLGVIAFSAQIRASRDLRELLMRQREFTTRVTHELKTPIAGIRVMAENLEAGAFKGDAQRVDMARRIVDESDRLGHRVDEILAVARRRTLPKPEPFDPEEAVLEAIDMWGPRLDAAGVRLHADLHPTEEVLGDQDAIRDAVSCLLDNALKYRDERRPDPQVWLTLTQADGWVVIEVADNGMGVPPEMRRSIFQRFVRVEGPNRGKAGGYGLGLAQVFEIMQAHKGEAAAEEGVDGGARFVLRIPAPS